MPLHPQTGSEISIQTVSVSGVPIKQGIISGPSLHPRINVKEIKMAFFIQK